MSCDFLMLEPGKARHQVRKMSKVSSVFPVPLLGLLNSPQSVLCQPMFPSAEWGEQPSKQPLGLSWD